MAQKTEFTFLFKMYRPKKNKKIYTSKYKKLHMMKMGSKIKTS